MNIFDFSRKNQTRLFFNVGRKGVKIWPKLFFVRMFTCLHVYIYRNQVRRKSLRISERFRYMSPLGTLIDD